MLDYQSFSRLTPSSRPGFSQLPRLAALALLAQFGRFASTCTNACCCWRKSRLVTRPVYPAQLQLNGPSPPRSKPNALSARFPSLYPRPASLRPRRRFPPPLFRTPSKSPFRRPFPLPRSLSPTPPLHPHLGQNILNSPVTFVGRLVFCLDAFIRIHELRKCSGGQRLRSRPHCIRRRRRNWRRSGNHLRRCSKGLFRRD